MAHQKSTGTGVIVAIIDTGIDVTHPELSANMISGWDFFNDTSNVYNPDLGMEQAHGTHIAGIISSVAPDVKIMPLKVFENGVAYTSDIIEAIQYAEANGAKIVNCSWGCTEYNQALKEVMDQSGMFFVTAVGNNRLNVEETPIYPASYGLMSTMCHSMDQQYIFLRNGLYQKLYNPL